MRLSKQSHLLIFLFLEALFQPWGLGLGMGQAHVQEGLIAEKAQKELSENIWEDSSKTSSLIPDPLMWLVIALGRE